MRKGGKRGRYGGRIDGERKKTGGHGDGREEEEGKKEKDIEVREEEGAKGRKRRRGW